MAQIIALDEFSGPTERLAAEFMASAFPDDWCLVCCKQIIQQDHSRQVDFILIGRYKIFVIEEKGWAGDIRGNENSWLIHGEFRRSPINQAEMSCKMLAGLLRGRHPSLATRGSNLVVPIVVMSSERARVTITDPRAKSKVFLLKDISKLIEQDLPDDSKTIWAERNDVIHMLTRLPSRPKKPARIGNYQILECREDQGLSQEFIAQHGDDSPCLLRVFYSPSPLDGAPESDHYLRRQYDAQRQLSEDGVCPHVDPYFFWDDQRAIVFPFKLPQGVSFAALNEKGPREEQILTVMKTGFQSLQKMHQKGIVHRSIRPDRVWWNSKTESIQFSDFVIARIDGKQTIVDRADRFDADHSYRSIECRIDLSQANPKSDVYSLGAVFLNWITGISPPHDECWDPTDAIDTRKDLDESLADSLKALFAQLLAFESGDRPTSQAVLEILDDLQAKFSKSEIFDDSQSYLSPEALRQTGARYEILERLGIGGTAETFLARDHQRDELVVLKRIIRPEVYSYLAKAEFKALNRLRHPCLPELIDIYGKDEPFHLKFKYVEGTSLKDLWREVRAMNAADRIRVVKRVAIDILEALQYLHSNDFLHRDVTPGNILVTEDKNNRVLLIDFGLASNTSEATSRVGTPIYSAPESEGPCPVWSAKADFYGLGVLLFELLSGQLPYAIEGSRRDKQKLIDFQTTGDETVDSLCRVLQSKACCPNPSHRYSSAAEMQESLLITLQPPVDPPATVPSDANNPSAIELPSHSHETRSTAINPFVNELRQAFRNSSLGNANNRGLDSEFSRRTYAPTELDEYLLPKILEGRWKCIALSGNPGDGKTAFLEAAKERLIAAGGLLINSSLAGWSIQYQEHQFVAIFDASESHDGQSSDDLLLQAIEPLRGNKEPSDRITVLLAINDGRLSDLIATQRFSFKWLCSRLRKQGESYDENDTVLLVDLKYRSPLSLIDNEPSLLNSLLDTFLQNQHWETCQRCVAHDTCFIRKNASSLSTSTVKSRLRTLLAGVYFVADSRPTIRDLRSALAWLITCDKDCTDIHTAVQSSLDSRYLYYNSAFSDLAGADLVIEGFRELDPADVVNPSQERRFAFKDANDRASAAGSYGNDLPSLRDRLADWKRREYFELCEEELDQQPTGLLPSRWLKEFCNLVSGKRPLQDAKELLLRGLQRIDQIPFQALQSDHFSVRLDTDGGNLAIIRHWKESEFVVELPPSRHAFLNYLPDHLILRRMSGWPEIRIGFPMFELLMRAAEGVTPDAVEHQSLIMDFRRFRAQLLTSPTSQISLVLPSGDARKIVSSNGIIKNMEGEHAS